MGERVAARGERGEGTAIAAFPKGEKEQENASFFLFLSHWDGWRKGRKRRRKRRRE